MLYQTAIARKPGSNFASGISTSTLGIPDYQKAILQHESYVRLLRGIGLDVIVLEADERYPDGCFVEDTAVVTSAFAIITQPGAASRNGEQIRISEVLKEFRKLFYIKAPGTLEGGDVLRIGDHFFIGLSERTNEAGIAQFDAIASQFGYTTTAVQLNGILHLKTGIAYIGHRRVLGMPIVTRSEVFQEYTALDILPEESYASNCIRIGTDHLILPAGFPKTMNMLQEAGYLVSTLDMSEFEKMDGGLTCLSLLF